MPDEAVGTAGLDSPVGRDDSERPPERAETRQRNQEAGKLHQLAGEMREAAVRRSREEHREATDGRGKPCDRPDAQLDRRAPDEEEDRSPALEEGDPEPGGCSRGTPVREVRPGEEREQADQQGARKERTDAASRQPGSWLPLRNPTRCRATRWRQRTPCDPRNAGARIRTNITGRMKIAIGTSIFTGAFCARSSA